MKLVRNDIKISELKETLEKETGLADDGKQGENKRRIAKHKQIKGKIGGGGVVRNKEYFDKKGSLRNIGRRNVH